MQRAQILDAQKGKSSVSCPSLFRHLMVDVISATVFGSRPGALDNFAVGVQDTLAMAVKDFPTRGIVVSRVTILPLIIRLTLAPFSAALSRLGRGNSCVVFPARRGGASATRTTP